MTLVKSLATKILSGSKWHLAPAGRTTCDYGVLATQSECASAVAALASVANRAPGQGIQVGWVGNGGTCNNNGWGRIPLGCSAQTSFDWTAHYKQSGPNCNNGDFQLVCTNSNYAGSLCDQLLQQFHRFDEELSIQGKWQGGSVTGVCRGWGTNKVRSIVHYNLYRYGRSLNNVHSCRIVPLYQFLSLQSMYHIVDTFMNKEQAANENAIINIFGEFIGCAVSTLIACLTCIF